MVGRALIGRELKTVGYLSRDTALDYEDAVEVWEGKGHFVSCKAALFGGTKEKPGIGAWLDLPDPEEIEDDYEDMFSSE